MSFVYNFCQFLLLSTVVFLLIAFSPTFIDVDPQPSSPVQMRELEGALAVNDRLNKLEKRFEGVISQPESLAFHKGKIYTGLGDGSIVEISGNTYRNISLPSEECSGPWEQHLCGRLLGMRITSDGFIYTVDAYKGLSKVDMKTGVRDVLIRAGRVVEGKPLMFLDDLFVDEQKNIIYMTDVSWKWNFKAMMHTMLELLPTGRVLKYDMKTGAIEVLVSGFIFTNGIQLTHDREALLISDTARSCIFRYHLEGPKKGQKDVFIDRLPGFPDNIRPSKRGGYWIAFGMFKQPGSVSLLDYTYELPLIARKVLIRVMDRFGVAVNFVSHYLFGSPRLKHLAYFISSHAYVSAIMAPNHGLIVEVDKDGNIVDSLHASNGAVQFISEVLEQDDGNIYLGSYVHNFIGVIPVK